MSDIKRFPGGLNRDTRPETMPAPVERIERVEFIIKQHTVICNVLTNQFQEMGVWKHKEFAASTSIIDFLMNGNMESAMQWPEGRKE